MLFDFADQITTPSVAHTTKPARLLAASAAVLPLLTAGRPVTTTALADILTTHCGGTDAQGFWQWKDAYEVLEIAQVRFLQKFAPALRPLSPEQLLVMLEKLVQLCPTHTKRSDDSARLQQFSTPLSIGVAALAAASLTPGDVVLEPSAGTGLLAVLARLHGAELILNELCETRAALLAELFPDAPLSRHNAESLHDRLDPALTPSGVLMNPPFSTSPNALQTRTEVTCNHLAAALARLPEGGRLVAITGEGFSPYAPRWRSAFAQLQQSATVQFSIGIAGRLFAKHGTTFETRLTVLDRIPAAIPDRFPEQLPLATSPVALLQQVRQHVTARQGRQPAQTPAQVIPLPVAPQPRSIIELPYTTRPWVAAATAMSDGLYEPYETQTIVIPGAHPHPSPLVQSAAMASVAPPQPTYRPHLYERLVTDGVLSAAQLESVIYAGEAHSHVLDGHYTVAETLETVRAASAETPGAVQFRRGWYLGDGTGCGKGRQVAGILLDNWLQGRRRAIWISKSDKLLEDARRDWAALGGNPAEIVPHWQFKQGQPITVGSGILFTTYSTLRTAGRQGKASRLAQLVDWCGADFAGCLIFDEAHAMANAAASKGSRGAKKPSQQGLAGIQLQNALPAARVVYVSATGATTVQNLAYATRLGLWGAGDLPFASQSEFVAEMERGGIAAMEMISRDLKAMGLYLARSLSYDGVQYDFLEHTLTPEQIRIYDAYAEAFQIIHQNIEAALEATNINCRDGSTRNGQAKSAVRSAFESNKQRFFNHLLVAMKCPTLIAAMTADLAAGAAVVVQIVSTNEALLERRLAEIPAAEWGDLHIDITPREYVLDYLMHGFPVQLHEVFVDENGHETTRPAVDEAGHPVLSREAVARRDSMVEALAALPPVLGALDQLIQHFGHEQVAEVTGRSRRVIRVQDGSRDRLAVQNRPASANLAETQLFMNDEKRILVFSDAGGTGRSYHADRGAQNQRQRVHYLLEAGWKADAAIQGLGRTNRTNQVQPPIFRPVATDVKGEKRFLSTIARRLDTLGAITRGQRQTGGQNLFREEANLESAYARAALSELYHALLDGRIACCSLARFEAATGLSLRCDDGTPREDLPPIGQFLNRVLALPIALQNDLFAEFSLRHETRIEQAKEAGLHDRGMETLSAERFTVLEELPLASATGTPTLCHRIERQDRCKVMTVQDALALAARTEGATLALNSASGRVALCLPTTSLLNEAGAVVRRVALLRPLGSSKMTVDDFAASGWQPIPEARFTPLWQQETDAAPAFRTSFFYLVTGLLLPVWRQLPGENVRVCRLQTDSGQRLLGRIVDPLEIEGVFKRFGCGAAAPVLGADEIIDLVMGQRRTVTLPNGLELRAATVMGRLRLEVCGFREAQKDHLKALGCLAEIISYRLRLFIPHTAAAVGIVDAVRQLA